MRGAAGETSRVEPVAFLVRFRQGAGMALERDWLERIAKAVERIADVLEEHLPKMASSPADDEKFVELTSKENEVVAMAMKGNILTKISIDTGLTVGQVRRVLFSAFKKRNSSKYKEILKSDSSTRSKWDKHAFVVEKRQLVWFQPSGK